MDMPPSRYRVVEQGRRLVVVDTLTGKRAASPPRAAGRGDDRIRATANAARVAGYPTFVTSRWFDNRAPRTIVINEASSARASAGVGLLLVALTALASLIWLLPALLVFHFILLANKNIRGALRAGITKWLDGLVQDAGSSRG